MLVFEQEKNISATHLQAIISVLVIILCPPTSLGLHMVLFTGNQMILGRNLVLEINLTWTTFSLMVFLSKNFHHFVGIYVV